MYTVYRPFLLVKTKIFRNYDTFEIVDNEKSCYLTATVDNVSHSQISFARILFKLALIDCSLFAPIRSINLCVAGSFSNAGSANS